jgi:hypothetical protein
MALNDGDKAECKDIARLIVKEVLSEHILCCPHGQLILKAKWLLVGICAGSGFAGGSLVLVVFKIITGSL